MDLLWQVLVNGVLLGGLYALMALGLALVWGVLNIVNIAHGAFIMLGAYVCYYLFAGLGAAPASLQFSEVYTALQTKVVDAQENPLPIIQVAKLYEVQSSCALSNHIWDGYWFIANGRQWAGMPATCRRSSPARSTRPG